MRKKLIFIFLILPVLLKAQKVDTISGYSLTINGAYNFRFAPDYQDEHNYPSGNIIPFNTGTIITHPRSLGKGFSLDAGIEKTFAENFGIRITGDYFNGTTFSINNLIPAVNTLATNNTWQYNGLRLIPSIVIYSNPIKCFRVYARIGAAIGLYNHLVQTNTFTMPTNNDTSITYQKIIASGNIPVGVAYGVGLRFHVKKKISIFCEASGFSMSYSPKKGEVTDYTVNGVDKFNNLNTSQKEIRYSNNYILTNNPDPNSPSSYFASSYPLSSIGITAGITVRVCK